MSDFAEQNRKLIAEGYPRVSCAGLRGAKQVAREQLGHSMNNEALRLTKVDVVMTPTAIREVAKKMDAIAREHCPEGCRPDLVIGAAIDHLYSIAGFEESKEKAWKYDQLNK